MSPIHVMLRLHVGEGRSRAGVPAETSSSNGVPMPSTIIVRYELKPECLPEHVGLIEGVFDQLRAAAPAGAHYSVYRSADGYEFTHVGRYDTDEARAAATESEAFAR